MNAPLPSNVLPIQNAKSPAESWPDLVPLDNPELELTRIDLAHLPGWAGDFARALSASTETPPELAAGMVLAACSVATARRLRVEVEPGYFEPCNLWVLVALPSGNRKSAVQSNACAPFLDWEHDQRKAMEPEIKRITSKLKTQEARIRKLRNDAAKQKEKHKVEELEKEIADIEAELPEIPQTLRIWTSDATPESLGERLAQGGGSLAWLSSEGGVFDLLQGLYSRGIPNLDLVLKAHSGDSFWTDRISRPSVYLKYPRLSIGLSPQPSVVHGLISKPEFSGRGLTSRFLYLLPPSPLGYRKLESHPIPDEVKNAYHAGLRAMLDWNESDPDKDGNRLFSLKLSREAYKEWHDFSLSIEERMKSGEDLEHFTGWAGKAPGAAARVAAVLHSIKHAHGEPWTAEITAETMNAALEIITVISVHSLAALDMMGANFTIAKAREVLDWIKRSKQNGCSVRDAFNALRKKFHNVNALSRALDILEERGYVKVIEQPKDGPGRPSSPRVRIRSGLW